MKENPMRGWKKQNASGSDNVKYINSTFLTSVSHMIDNIAIYKSVTNENLMEMSREMFPYIARSQRLKRNDQVAATYYNITNQLTVV